MYDLRVLYKFTDKQVEKFASNSLLLVDTWYLLLELGFESPNSVSKKIRSLNAILGDLVVIQKLKQKQNIVMLN